MLILSRKVSESIWIGDDVEIVALEVKGKQIRLGIQAPNHVKVHRSEIYDRIQKELLRLEQLEKQDKQSEPEETK